MERKNRGKLTFSYLLKAHLFSTMIFVGVAFIIVALFIYFNDAGASVKQKHIQDFTSYYFEYNLFEEAPFEDLVGKKGEVLIFDAENNMLFSSNDTLVFDINDIIYIQDYYSESTYKIYENNDSTINLVEVYQNDLWTQTSNSYTLDKNLNVINGYSYWGEITKSHFSESEIKYLTDTMYEDYKIRKFSYNDNNGAVNTAVLFFENSFLPNSRNEMIMGFSRTIVILILTYIAIVLIFIKRVSKTVSQPLKNIEVSFRNYTTRSNVVESPQNTTQEIMGLYDAYNAMVKRTKKYEDDKSQIIASISHDLKTPITIIQGYANMMSDGLLPDVQKEKYINLLLEKTQYLTRLIDEFHRYSKMEHPKYELSLKTVNLSLMFRDYVADKYNELDINKYNIVVDISEEDTFVNIDEFELTRAFDNLISNSVKYNPFGVDIFVGLQLNEKKVIITIADSGKGVSKDIENEIFTPFIMEDIARNTNSSGMGLAITRRIIELHKGSISLISPPTAPYNIQFEIELPII